MKRIMMIIMLATLAPIGPAGASVLPDIHASQSAGLALARHYVQVTPSVRIAVKGERERRQVRFARLVASWTPDKRAVAAAEGFPFNRLLELRGSERTEIWTFPESHTQYIFDAAGHLIDRRIR